MNWFLFSIFADESFIILGINNKQTLIFYYNAFSQFFLLLKLNIIMLMFYQLLSCHCSLLHNQIQHILYYPKSQLVIGQHTGFSKFLFATGALLKQPVCVFIWLCECLGDLFPATE